MNYCIDTVSVNAMGRFNTVNVGVYTASIGSGKLRLQVASPIVLDTVITEDCKDC